jgi:hypothetical protein
MQPTHPLPFPANSGNHKHTTAMRCLVKWHDSHTHTGQGAPSHKSSGLQTQRRPARFEVRSRPDCHGSQMSMPPHSLASCPRATCWRTPCSLWGPRVPEKETMCESAWLSSPNGGGGLQPVAPPCPTMWRQGGRRATAATALAWVPHHSQQGCGEPTRVTAGTPGRRGSETGCPRSSLRARLEA